MIIRELEKEFESSTQATELLEQLVQRTIMIELKNMIKDGLYTQISYLQSQDITEDQIRSFTKLPRKNIGEADECPHCQEQWKGQDIFEYFMEAKYLPEHEQHEQYKNCSIQEIHDAAGSYGYNISNPRFFKNVIGIQMAHDHPEHHDGISYWKCSNCHYAWNRFSGEKTDQFLPKEDK